MTKEELDQLATVRDLEALQQKIITALKSIMRKDEPSKQFYTPKEFSTITGMKYSTVVHYCKMGNLKARQEVVKGAWKIDSSEVDRFRTESQKNIE